LTVSAENTPAPPGATELRGEWAAHDTYHRVWRAGGRMVDGPLP